MTVQPEPAGFVEAGPADDLIAGYVPVPPTRADGWTVERQKLFLSTLAETGCVSDAARVANITPRSAYRLRARPEGAMFALAWDKALYIATHRLMTLAWERACYGATEQVWQEGRLVAERRRPPDRLLMYLLRNLDTRRFGGPQAWAVDARLDAAKAFARATTKLVDNPLPVHATEWDLAARDRAELDEG